MKRRSEISLIQGMWYSSCRLWITLTLCSLLTLSSPVKAQNDYHIYAAFGPLFTFPGSLRVGMNHWELGLLGYGSYGFDKIFIFDHSYYTGFGLVLGPGTSPGFYGSLGIRKELFWGLHFRGELASIGLINGFLKADGQVGLTFEF